MNKRSRSKNTKKSANVPQSQQATQPASQVQSAAQPVLQSAKQVQPAVQSNPRSTWAKETDLKELIGSVNYFVKGADHRFKNAESAIKDHEARLRALEGKGQSDPEPTQPAPQPEPNPRPASEPKPDPEPKPQSEPQSQTNQPAQTALASAKTSVRPRLVYRVWDYEARCYYPVLDIWSAKEADSEYTPVWAWVDKDGVIVRMLTKEELKKYIP